MARKRPRVFAGLTWPQVCFLRDVACGAKYVPARGREAWSLSMRAIPLVEMTKHGWKLTSAGENMWLAMQEWQPQFKNI
jgi:hypothetical protein